MNRLRWDEMAHLHVTTYDIETPDSTGKNSLKALELEELGDPAGQRICHLQCHIGGGTLSLARMGATVVGVDFSPTSIEITQRRAERTGLADRVSFVCASVYEVSDVQLGKFDGVYTSWGVLCWLPDIDAWARVIASLLSPGGWFYLAESHPYATAIRWPDIAYGGGAAHHDESQGDYTSDDAVFAHPQSWQWSHGLGEVVSALTTAGMRLEWLHEHREAAWHLNDKEHLVERPNGMWEEPGSTLPLSFSLRATKSA